MALISCPECGNEISDQAKNCPHCGVPITKEKTNNKNILIALIVILIVVFGVFIIIIQQYTGEKNELEFKNVSDQKVERQIIKKASKNPYNNSGNLLYEATYDINGNKVTFTMRIDVSSKISHFLTVEIECDSEENLAAMASATSLVLEPVVEEFIANDIDMYYFIQGYYADTTVVMGNAGNYYEAPDGTQTSFSTWLSTFGYFESSILEEMKNDFDDFFIAATNKLYKDYPLS